MEEIKVNKYQTKVTEEALSLLPQELQDAFKEFIFSVPFIRNLISPARKYARDLPRDDKGRIIVDLTNPHILENMDYFRPAALHYLKYGSYTTLKPNRNPNSPFGKWIREEIRRCWEGYVRPSDGEWVTGYMYFYLNYVPMMVTKASKDPNKRRASRVEGFPEVWEGTYWRFHYIDQARNGGKYNNFEGGQHGVELSKRGSGKAHPYDTDVFTPQGLRKWGDLQIGDYVYGDDGKPAQIIDIPFDGKAPIYRLTLKDGRTIEASEGHLWKVYRHNRGIEILSTKELLSVYKAKRKVSYRNPLGVEYTCGIVRNQGVDMSYQPVGIDPYTMGLILGDGCFRTPDYNSCIYYTCQDSDAEYIIPLIPYEVKKNKTKYSYGIVIPGATKYLDSLGLWMHKSEDKFIPKVYLHNSRELRKKLLMGLIDSDGYVSNASHPMNGYQISVSSKRFADDIMWLCRSLGYNVSIASKHPWYYNKNKERVYGLTSYRINIYTDDALSNLPRKNNVCSNSAYSRSKQNSTRIVNIEYVGEKQAKCITVDNTSHCYLVGDFITTHNSFVLASIMAHNLLLGENAEAHKRTTTILTAYLREYLAEKDGTFSKFTPIKSFLAEKMPAIPRRMLTDSPNKMSWKSGYKDKLTGADMGDQNILLGLSSKDDVAKIRGKRGYILFEEFGSFPNLVEIYNNVRDGMKEGKYVYGFAYLVGTAGDKDSDFHGAQELVYNPKGYDVYALPNVWDKPNQGRPWFAFFTPAYINLKGYYNKDGVSDITGGLLHLLKERYRAKYETGDPRTIIKVVSNMPITPSEAMIQGGVSQFPVTDIEQRLLEINANPNFYDDVYVGQIGLKDGKTEFVPTSDTPIRYFQQRDNKNMPGAIEIFELPQRDTADNVYENRYIAGADPYDNDESTTTSLGSIIILDLWTDRIVAEYTGRPPMADDYFEICRRLCLFYNARLNYENNKKGLFSHFSTMNSTYLLTDVLEILVDKQMMKPGGVGNTAKGTNATAAINGWARQLIAKWLLLPQTAIVNEGGEDKEVTLHNLNFIKNKALLIELSQWNPFGNFDRVSALGMLMLLREDKLRLMGGRYDAEKQSSYDPDDIVNDDYWKDNFPDDDDASALSEE